MAHRKTLSAGQIEVLGWVDGGCPAGVMDDMSARITAAALRKRGLVETSGRGPTWQASITATGRVWLAEMSAPGAPLPRQGNVSVTEQLVKDVIAAGGSLNVARFHGGGVDYHQRVMAVERHRKAPPGTRLTLTHLSATESTIELVPILEGADQELGSVPVPVRVSRYHPAVGAFKEHAEEHRISRAALARVLRILQGLAVEAERRGWACQPVCVSGFGAGGFLS